MSTAPPWYAGSTITAAALNELVPQTVTLAADLPSLGTTAAQAILTLSNIAVGTYHLSGHINYEGAQNAGAVALSLHAAGPFAVSSMWMNLKAHDAVGTSSTAQLYCFTLTALGSAATSGVMTSGGNFVFEYDGIIVVSTAGSLSVDLAQTIAADTFISRQNSYARLETVLT